MKEDLLEKYVKIQTLLNEEKKAYYSKNLYEFQRDILKWPDLYEPFHRRVCDFITDNVDKKGILLLLPRGTFKSSLVTVGYTLWRIAQNPNERILIANATYPMAVQFLSQIKNHLTRNEEFKKIFGNYAENTDQWREDKIAISRDKSYEAKEPTVTAFGIGGNLVGSHFSFALLDDVVARDNIGTKEQIEKVKNFYKDSLDLIDPIKGRKQMIIIGTSWHWDDLYQWIEQDLQDDFAILRLPAFEGDWDTGKLLFPSRLTWKVLSDLKKKQGAYHFSAQYMLNPVPEENQTFKPPFKDYEESDLEGVELRTYMAVDPAISEKTTADYSTIVVVSVDKNNIWYIRDIFRKRVLPNVLIDEIFFHYQKWKPLSIALETVAYQKMLRYAINDQMKERRIFIPIKELPHTTQSKEDRIKGLQPRYEQGAIFHPQKTSVPNVENLEDELVRFPLAKHDDVLDALASILELSTPPRVREESKGFKRNFYPA